MDLTEAEEYTEELYKKDLWPRWSWWCDHSPRARYPGMQSQVGLRKHHYKQSWWMWWNSIWGISNPQRWCESVALNMPTNLENSAMATGLEKISFHSNPKERQCQRMFKLQHSVLISHASKVMLKILQARLQQYMNWEIPAELFHIIKDDAVKVSHSICQQIWKTQ